MPGRYEEVQLKILEGHNEHPSMIILEQGSANPSLQTCFCTPCMLGLVFTFLKGCNKNEEKICDRDHM